MNNEIQIIGMSNEPLEKIKILQVPSTSGAKERKLLQTAEQIH